MAIKRQLTIEEVWELINTLLLQSSPPSEESVQFIEQSANEGINNGNGEHENLYEYFVQETSICEVISEWCEQYEWKTLFLHQYTDHTLREYYRDYYMSDESYEDATLADKMTCCIYKYIQNYPTAIRLR